MNSILAWLFMLVCVVVVLILVTAFLPIVNAMLGFIVPAGSCTDYTGAPVNCFAGSITVIVLQGLSIMLILGLIVAVYRRFDRDLQGQEY